MIISDSLDDRWDSLWIFDAFWHVLYAGILMAIAFLWSPNKNNLQYAYADELLQDEDEEEDGEEGEEEEASALAKDACARAPSPDARRAALARHARAPADALRPNRPGGERAHRPNTAFSIDDGVDDAGKRD